MPPRVNTAPQISIPFQYNKKSISFAVVGHKITKTDSTLHVYTQPSIDCVGHHIFYDIWYVWVIDQA